MNEAETAYVLKDAMRRYSVNRMSDSELGIFKGVETEDGVTVTLKLVGRDVRVSSYEPVDVSEYEKKIATLQETVEKQAEEIKTLKEAEETPTQETTSLTTAVKSASVQKRRRKT